MNLDELDRRAGKGHFLFQRIDDMACGAVTGIKHQLQRLEIRYVDITEKVIYILLQHGDGPECSLLILP